MLHSMLTPGVADSSLEMSLCVPYPMITTGCHPGPTKVPTTADLHIRTSGAVKDDQGGNLRLD